MCVCLQQGTWPVKCVAEVPLPGYGLCVTKLLRILYSYHAEADASSSRVYSHILGTEFGDHQADQSAVLYLT